MKSGTFNNSISDQLKENANKGISREEVNQFLSEVADALHSHDGSGMPAIEVSRKVVEHYNKGHLEGFDSAGYFIYAGVKIFEEGKRQEAEKRDGLTIEEKVFGGRR